MNSKDNSILEPILNLYLKKDYQASAQQLQKIKEQLDPGLYYYNLGSLQMKMKAYGDARHSLELARLNGFETAEVFHNLQIVESVLGIDDLSSSSDFFDQAIVFAKNQPFAIYLSLSLAAVVVTLSLKKFTKISKQLTLALLILSALPVLFKSFVVDHWRIAFAREKARVYSGPSEVFTDTGELLDGTALLIGKKSGHWFFIDRPRHLSGWINGGELRFVSNSEESNIESKKEEQQ